MADGAPNGPDVFLSYAREDEARAHELATALGQHGFTVFWDREIPPGETWHSHIGEALANARCIVVAWSRHSIASQWVLEEASEGRDRKVLVPVLFEALSPPFGFRAIQAANLIDWHPGPLSPAFDRLLGAVQRILRGRTGSGIEPEPESAARPPPVAAESAPKTNPSLRPAPPPVLSRPPFTRATGRASWWSSRTVMAMGAGVVILAVTGGAAVLWRLMEPAPPIKTAAPVAEDRELGGREREPSMPAVAIEPSGAPEPASTSATEAVPPAPIAGSPSVRIAATKTQSLAAAASNIDEYRDKINAKGPVAYWRFNDNDNVATDHNATAPGHYIGGRIQEVDAIVQGVGADKAVELSAGAYVEVPYEPAVQTAEFSVVGHARVDDLSAKRTLISKDRFGIEVTPVGALRAYIFDARGDRLVLLTDDGLIAPDRPFAFGLSVGAAGLKLYLNGRLETGNPEITSGPEGTDALQFGRYASATDMMEGTIDEFAWFPRQLTNAEMADLSSPLLNSVGAER